MDTIITKPKNGYRLQVLLGGDLELRNEFLVACKRQNKSGSQVIVQLMRDFIKAQTKNG
tara:strand:- start:120 stop:296 length:177 start_codon:yes stop_codon:yes gene_type:complete